MYICIRLFQLLDYFSTLEESNVREQLCRHSSHSYEGETFRGQITSAGSTTGLWKIGARGSPTFQTSWAKFRVDSPLEHGRIRMVSGQTRPPPAQIAPAILLRIFSEPWERNWETNSLLIGSAIFDGYKPDQPEGGAAQPVAVTRQPLPACPTLPEDEQGPETQSTLSGQGQRESRRLAQYFILLNPTNYRLSVVFFFPGCSR